MSILRRPRGDSWAFDVGPIERKGVKLTAGEMSGAQMWFTLKIDPTDPDPGVIQVTHVSSASGQIVIDAATATAVVNIDKSVTAIAVGVYEYDVQLLEASGFQSTPARGKLIVTQDVTAA